MKTSWKIIIGLQLAVIIGLGGWVLLGKGRTTLNVGGSGTKAVQSGILTDTTRVPAALRQEEIYSKADHGDLEAMYMVGAAFKLGYQVPKNDAAAMAWFRKAADNGYAYAQLLLGEAYLTGTEGVPKDSTVALKWLRKAADGDNPRAQYLLGCMYRNGENGLPKDDFAAYDLLDKAGQRDDTIEQWLTEMVEKYPQLNPVNYVKSLDRVMAVPGAVQFKFFTFDSGQYTKSVPPYLTLKYSVAWPVSGCSPEALAAMQETIARLFVKPIYGGTTAYLTAAELRNPQLWLERRAQVAAHNVIKYGSTEPQTENLSFSVIHQGDGMISGILNADSQLLCIGVHGYSGTMPVSFDLRTGRRLTLADIFKEGSRSALAVAIRKALHRVRAITSDERLDANGFVKDESIRATEEFCLVRDRIWFFYDRYEIADGITGEVVADVRYANIAELLRTDIPAATLWREGRAHAMLPAVVRPPENPPPVEVPLLEEKADKPKGKISIKLNRPLKFIGKDVREISRRDVPALRKLPVWLGDDNQGLEMAQWIGCNWGGETKKVRTCEEYKALVAQGYGSTHFDDADEGYFKYCTALLDCVERAQVPTRSFISKPRKGVTNLELLPLGLLPMVEDSEEKQLRKDAASGVSIQAYVKQKEATVERTVPSHVNEVSIHWGGMERYLCETARGDFNGDGVEDILAFAGTYAEGGSYQAYDVFLLTRSGPKAMFKVAKVR